MYPFLTALVLALPVQTPPPDSPEWTMRTLQAVPFTGPNADQPVRTLPADAPGPPGVRPEEFLPRVTEEEFRAGGSFDLAARAAALARHVFAAPVLGPAGLLVGFGDVAGVWVTEGDHTKLVSELEERIKAADARFAEELWPLARELLMDGFARSGKPWVRLGERVRYPDDGFAFAPPLTLANKRVVWQGATLIPLARPPAPQPGLDGREALRLYESAQRDLAAYSTKAWNRRLQYAYKGGELLSGSRYISADGKTAFWRAAYTVRIIAGHPIESWVRESVTDDGRLEAQSYCPNPPPGMLKYQQGRDTVIPVKDSKGDVVALLLVTTLACDQQPVQTIRESLGTMAALVAVRSGLPAPKIEDDRSEPP